VNTVLELNGISKRFGHLLANDDISLSLNSGEILALLGENGAGKTTLMNVLFGHYAPDAGQILVRQKPLKLERTDAALKSGIGMVHQHFTLADNLSVLDNIMLGTESLLLPFSRRRAALRKLQQLMQTVSLDIDPSAKVGSLAVGEKQRVEILKVLYRDANILILDEPTAVLTPQEVDSLFQMLRTMAASGIACILITGELVERPQLAPMTAGHTLVELRDVSVDFSSSQVSLQDINLNVKRHHILGIAGVSGNGQQALAAVLTGQLKPSTGQCFFLEQSLPESELSVAAIPEDRHKEGIVGEMFVWENLLLDDLGKSPCWIMGVFLNRGASKQRADQQVNEYDVRCASLDTETNLLSGGNIQKLILARKLAREPQVIVANQPTRGLDEGAIAFVHQQLLDARQRGAGIVLISEDLDELLSISDDIAVISGGRLSKTHATRTVSIQALGSLMTSNLTADDVAQSSHAV